MMTTLVDLLTVLEDEVQLGERLLHNLNAQKAAIVAWDSSALLLHVEEKEHLVRQLAESEQKRSHTVRQLLEVYDLPAVDDVPSLKTLLAQLPTIPHRAALEHLQNRAWQIYSRLRAGEQHMTTLMGMLLTHISEALGSVTRPSSIMTYGEKGRVAVARPAPGFVQEKI